LGMILTGLNRNERELAAAFEQGFSSSVGSERLVREEIGSTVDKVRAVHAVESMQSRGIRVFLVHVYGLNAACLEKIADADGYFIVEGYSAFSFSPDHLLLSIEDDYAAALARLLQNMDGPGVPFSLPGKLVPGPLVRQETSSAEEPAAR